MGEVVGEVLGPGDCGGAGVAEGEADGLVLGDGDADGLALGDGVGVPSGEGEVPGSGVGAGGVGVPTGGEDGSDVGVAEGGVGDGGGVSHFLSLPFPGLSHHPSGGAPSAVGRPMNTWKMANVSKSAPKVRRESPVRNAPRLKVAPVLSSTRPALGSGLW